MSLLELLGEEAPTFHDELPCALEEANQGLCSAMPEAIGLWRMPSDGGGFHWYAEGGGITVVGRTPEEAVIRLMRHLRIVTHDKTLALLNQQICHGCSAPCCDVTKMNIIESKDSKGRGNGIFNYSIDFRSNVPLNRGDLPRMFMAMMRRESGDKMEPTNDD